MPQSFLLPRLGHFYRSTILTDRQDIFVDWGNVAHTKTISFSPTLRKKSTLLDTVRCFFIGHVSRGEVQFEGMCLSVSGNRYNEYVVVTILPAFKVRDPQTNKRRQPHSFTRAQTPKKNALSTLVHGLSNWVQVRF